MNREIAERRLLNQGITRAGHVQPADVVAWFGAVQAQEYEAAKWGLGLRLRDGAIDAPVEHAFETGQLLRTHVMRPTWHFVAPADIRWLLDLTAPRVHLIVSSYNRRQELDARTLVRGTAVIERALRDQRAALTFQHALVVGGQVAGTWRKAQNARAASIRATLLRRLTARERRALANAVDRYQTFLGCQLELSVF
jgi:DNA glycosylase AlkZ-like